MVRRYTFTAILLIAGLWLLMSQDTSGARKAFEERQASLRPVASLDANTPFHAAQRSRTAARSPARTLPYALATDDRIFTETRFEVAKAHAYADWYMQAREQIERCTVFSENLGEMCEVRLIFAYQPELAVPGMHTYIVEDVDVVEEPGREPLDERQKECLSSVRGSAFHIMAPFHEIPETHHHFMTSDTMPVP